MPSSVIDHIHYNTNTQTLRVTYLSGNIYDYKKVPEKVYKRMKAAVSKGKYLNEQIKGYYDFEKVEDTEK